MQYKLNQGSPLTKTTDCLILGVYADRKLSAPAKLVNSASKRILSRYLRSGDMDGNQGQSLLLHEVPGIRARRILLVGCGEEKKLDTDGYVAIIRHSIQLLLRTGCERVISQLTELQPAGMNTADKYRHAVATTASILYRYDDMRSKETTKPAYKLREIHFSYDAANEAKKDCQRGMQQGVGLGEGMALTKNLANTPPNICHPAWLAEQARKLARKHGFPITVLSEARMRQLGMGSLLSVSQGSSQPAKLIAMEYWGTRKKEKPIVLVGKGVTFDTGGISIKPAAAMDEMKFDMCGAASVFGTLHAVAAMKLPVNVMGVIPATENMPGGKATRPGDIVTSMSGRTIEILNTDAEGRLILCDALTWSKRYNPAIVIDIATLTGACIIALGNQASGMLSNDRKLADSLLEAGEQCRDRIWELPLWKDYRKQLQSPFADIANIGGRGAGTITAACFLSYFTEEYRWAHLDIAGTAWTSGKNKGATARPVHLLTQYILNYCS